MPEKPRDAVTALAEELASEFGSARAASGAVVETRPPEEATQVKLGDDSAPNSEYTTREHVLSKQQVAFFDVWVSDIVCKTMKYRDVQADIESSPTAIIIRTYHHVITGEGPGMHKLRASMARETVPALTLAKSGATEEWALTTLVVYGLGEVDAAINPDTGKLVVVKIPTRGAGNREPAND